MPWSLRLSIHASLVIYKTLDNLNSRLFRMLRQRERDRRFHGIGIRLVLGQWQATFSHDAPINEAGSEVAVPAVKRLLLEHRLEQLHVAGNVHALIKGKAAPGLQVTRMEVREDIARAAVKRKEGGREGGREGGWVSGWVGGG